MNSISDQIIQTWIIFAPWLILATDALKSISVELIASAFAIYFAWQKIGNKVIARSRIEYNIRNAPSISEVCLSNLKDKPLAVYEILLADKENNKYMSIFQPKHPTIIEGLTSKTITLDPASSYSPEPFFTERQNLITYIRTEKNIIKCQSPKIITGLTHKKFKRMQLTTIDRSKFNGVIYDSSKIRYALVYIHNGKQGTSLITNGGFITDFNFSPNSLNSSSMESLDKMREDAEVASGTWPFESFSIVPLL